LAPRLVQEGRRHGVPLPLDPRGAA